MLAAPKLASAIARGAKIVKGAAMNWLLHKGLSELIRRGTLHVTTASGRKFTVGDGTGKPVAIRFTTAKAQRAILFDPELRTGEAYMDGTLVMEQGSIADFLGLAMSQYTDGVPFSWTWAQHAQRFLLRRLQQANRRGRARANVAHHYNINEWLYSTFLDSDWQYSCAYFGGPEQSIDEAQLNKKRHLAAKLLVAQGNRVLDIGSGWGGLALYLAEYAGAHVTGVTLSEPQLARATERAQQRALSERAVFKLEDYRDVTGRFDRIVSVGMFEHVGVGFYDAFFRKCASLLEDDGIFVLHTIGRLEGPSSTNPWAAKYIFPGGYGPALSEVLPAIERSGLRLADIEVLRMHYAYTLRAWRERFLAHADAVKATYDERFLRMWEFYLAGAEMAFFKQDLVVFQLQLTKRMDVVPITRDYIAREEKRLLGLEQARRPLGLVGEGAGRAASAS
jgi:cyclopropane-fatty-acyl-phospholipid synthase